MKVYDLKICEKAEGLNQNKIGHYVLGKARIDTFMKIDKDILHMS